MSNLKNIAFLTSSARGLAHYVVHLYEPIKKYTNPYYVTYADREVDSFVGQKVGRVYQIIQNQSASSVLETINFFKRKKIDLINLHVSDTVKKMHFQYFATLAYAKYLRIPICLTIHDVFSMEAMYIDPAAVELMYKLGDSFIVGNETEKDKLQFYFNKKESDIVVVPHGPYDLFDQKKYNQTQAKKELGLTGKNIILFFGQIRPNKGLKYLIKSLPLIIQKNKNIMLYISTDLHLSTPELNEYLSRIENSGVKDHIRIVKDYIPSEEIEKIFKAADLVALPYTQVSQSGILNLAFAFKKPVILSNVFYESQAVKDNNMGCVFESQNYKQLAQTVIDMFANKEQLKQMGINGYNYSQKKSNWKDTAKLTNQAFDIAYNKINQKL